MKSSRLVATMIKQMLKPRRRYSGLLLAIFALISFVVFVVDQLTSYLPALANVDIQLVIIEEHHEGNWMYIGTANFDVNYICKK